MAYERVNTIGGMNEKDLAGFINVKFDEMKELSKNDGLKSLDKQGVEDFQTRNAELTEARERHGQLRATSDAFKKQSDEHMKAFGTPNRQVPFQTGNSGGDGSDGQPNMDALKSLGERFTESDAYKNSPRENLGSAGAIMADIPGMSLKSIEALKATMTTSAGWQQFPMLSPRPPVMTALQKPVVADLIPQDDTTAALIYFYRETAFSDNAAATAEGATKPEATLTLTLINQPVSKIAITLPMTDEQLQDVPAVQGYINNRLTLMIKRAEDQYLLTGTGVSPQILGLHNVPGIGSIARASNEDNTDTILRAITDVNSITGYAQASGVILNPANWQTIRLLRTTTGEYIWGHPALVGPATVWGLPVVETSAETSGKGIVADFQMYTHISRRLGIKIDVGYINDDFTKDIQRIRMEERLSLEVYRAAAVDELTNLN